MVYIPYTIEELTGGAYSIDEDFVTSIDEAPAAAKQHDAAIYDLTGRRVENIANAGIYIVNGKKVIVK